MTNMAKAVAAAYLTLFGSAASYAAPRQAVESQAPEQKDTDAIRLARKDLNEALASRNLERYAS